MSERSMQTTGGFWFGLAALGLWLGWTATTFAALSTPEADPASGDIAASISIRLTAEGVTPTPPMVATAYLLADRDCGCNPGDADPDAPDTAALAGALDALGVALIDLRGHADDRPYTVALLDARGALRYAGPPSFSLGCVRGDIATSVTIARLLEGSEPLLVAPLPCSC